MVTGVTGGREDVARYIEVWFSAQPEGIDAVHPSAHAAEPVAPGHADERASRPALRGAGQGDSARREQDGLGLETKGVLVRRRIITTRSSAS